MRLALPCAVLLFSCPATLPAAAEWKAGAARQSITPATPIWMTGYGSRTHPSTGVAADLFVRALALDDGSSRPAVLVTIETLGLPAAVAAAIAQQVEKQHAISRDRLILSFSHTHGAPALTHPHRMLYIRATPEEVQAVDAYTRRLQDQAVAAVGAALRNLQPARLKFGRTRAAFAMNRRQSTPDRGVILGVNPDGPTDPDVPLLLVESAQGQRLAVVFGYACHNTTVGGDCYDLHGDYAGFVQAELEKADRQSVALFVMGCGADINPNPRGTLDHARRHGADLAAAVTQGLAAPMQPVAPSLRSEHRVFPLAFAAPPSREALQAQLQHKDPYHQWQAQELLKRFDRDGKLPTSYPCQLQAWRLGNQFTLLAMSGEVVVDYALRLKRELGADNLWVAGYCNDLFAYVPTRRILEEGGYEPANSTVYYVQPGPFAPTIEDTIIRQAHTLVTRVRGSGNGSSPQSAPMRNDE